MFRSEIDVPEAISVLGRDDANGTFPQLYWDDRGVSRIYQMSLTETEWKLWRNGEPFAQRFVAAIEDGGNTLRGRWELAEDRESFRLDFELIYRRQ